MNRTRLAFALLISLGLLSLYSPGQSETPAPPSSEAAGNPMQWVVAPLPPPQTKLEAFAARKNVVIVKGYTKVNEIPGDDGAVIRITAVEFADADHPGSRQLGLAMQVQEAGRAGRSAVSYVDFDEIDALMSAIERLTQLSASATKLTEYDAGYRTRGDLELTNLTHDGSRSAGIRSVQVLVPSGQIISATAYFRLARLSELHQQLGAAKQTLDKLPVAASAEK